MAEGEIQSLPEGCISHIISHTSPSDACRLAAVSPIFRAAADSDTVWERFLPSDVLQIVSTADPALEYASTKELYFRLCDSVLLEGGRKSFSLERSSGRKCFLISARDLWITWGDSPEYWEWVPASSCQETRFPEVAILRSVCWLQIGGGIDCRILSEKTVYSIYLIYKIEEDAYGLDSTQNASIMIGGITSEATVCLDPDDETDLPMVYDQIPGERKDGWREIELGRFFCDDGSEGEVEFYLKEVTRLHWKSGMVLEGIELRPAFGLDEFFQALSVILGFLSL